MSYVFLRSNIANRTSYYFSYFTGINIQELSFRETILTWWNAHVRKREKTYFHALIVLSFGNYGEAEIESSMKGKYHRTDDDIQHY